MTAAAHPPISEKALLRQRSDALHAEYRDHLESGCWSCQTGRWCPVESELDFQCDVAVRAAYGN